MDSLPPIFHCTAMWLTVLLAGQRSDLKMLQLNIIKFVIKTKYADIVFTAHLTNLHFLKNKRSKIPMQLIKFRPTTKLNHWTKKLFLRITYGVGFFVMKGK